MTTSLPAWFGIVFSLILGGIIGSFLNACIHRMPRGIKLSFPRRSFCPSCDASLPWYHNLPILSYLFLRGKCGFCGERISPRYLVVEMLTAGLFVLAYLTYGLPLAPVYWLLLALLIGATFIDLEHLIIPDEFTWGGIGLGLALSFLIPEMMGETSRWSSLGQSLLGAAGGFFLLWAVVEGGKLAFGRKKVDLEGEQNFHWKREGETASLTIDDETLQWEEVFSRASDRLILECTHVEGPDGPVSSESLVFYFNRCQLQGREHKLDDLEEIRGKVTAIIIPREAMGFGDVKFIGAIGAFLGWQAVLFTIFASSVVGCFFGVAAMIIHRRKGGTVIPFGPFLALGALIWLFGGKALWDWYFRMF